jgi:hypothetical protein
VVAARFEFKRVILYAVLAALWLGAGALRAQALDYESRWEGKLGGKDQFYIPQRVVAGNFTRDPGHELLVIDSDGYAYFLGWRTDKLINLWITSGKVAQGRVAGLAAADGDNCGYDEGALLGPEGQLVLLGGGNKEFKVICKSCLPQSYASFHGEFLAPAQADSDQAEEIMLIGNMDGKPWMLVAKVSGKKARVLNAAALPEIDGEIMSLWPATDPPGDRFYLSVYRGARGDVIVPLRLSEEGATAAEPISLAKAGLAVRGVYAADTDSDGASDLFVSGTTGKGADARPAMMIFAPGEEKNAFRTFPSNMPDPGFIVAPDLNGDDLREIVLISFSGKARIMSLATISLVVSGKPVKKKNTLLLVKKRAYVPLSVLPGASVKEKDSLVMIKAGKRTLVLNSKTGAGTLSLPGQEESKVMTVPVTVDQGVVFYDALKLCNALGIKVQWNLLTQTLSIQNK